MYRPTASWPQTLRFLSVGTLKNHRCIHFQLQTKTLHQRIFDPRQTISKRSGSWNGATVHDQMCPCWRSLRWITFWVILGPWHENNNKSIVIYLGTYVINVLCEAQIKFQTFKVFIVEYNLPLNSKTAHFWHMSISDILCFNVQN